MLTFPWGLLLGFVVGVAVTVVWITPTLCKNAVDGKANALLDALGVSSSSPVRSLVDSVIY